MLNRMKKLGQLLWTQSFKIMAQDSILLIDAYNVFTRHFCANPTMDRHGEPIGGVVGFLNGLKNIVSEVFPSKVFVVWEGGLCLVWKSRVVRG